MKTYLLGIVAAALVAGCMVGPDFERPVVEDMPSEWLAPQGAEAAEYAASTNWWASFGDAELDSLLARGRGQNLSLRQSVLRIEQSRASLRQVSASLGPSLSASAGASETKNWNPSETRESYKAGLDASWEIDLFGGNRRSREAAIAELEATECAHAASVLALESEIADRYFDLRLQQANLDTTRSNLVLQAQSLEIARARSEAGVTSELDRLSTEAQYHSTQAQIPSLEAGLSATVRSLELLLGLVPGALDAELADAAPVPLATALPQAGVPADILDRRPDVRQSEARLHAATAQVGAALADRFPKVTIGGSASMSSDSISSWGDAIKALGGNVGLSVPIFNSGAKKARYEQQKLALEELALAYRETVLTALSEVETAWRALEREQARTGDIEKSADYTRDAAELANRLYDAGQADYQEVISRQSALLSAEQALNQHRASLASGAVALYRALGGGY